MATRTNILAFDGGGTRGQTSLIILQAIMLAVNSILDIPGVTLTPQDIFDAVSGTSTGGLIAIMLGRFGMSVDQCIDMYDSLAERIFSKKKLLGYLTKSIFSDKYSSKPLRECVGELARAHVNDKNAPMRCDHAPGRIPCTVITCRLDHSGAPESGATFICTHMCEPDIGALISDAAHATTAAPPYFRECWLGGRLYIDGGFGHNNPTWDTYGHYDDEAIRRLAPDVRGTGSEAFRIVSLGTGRPLEEASQAGQQPQIPYIPNPSKTSSLKRISTRLKHFMALGKAAIRAKTSATNNDALIGMVGRAKLEYLRIDGAKGVKQFPLDACDPKIMRKMRQLTEAWLLEPEGKQQVTEIAQILAEEWNLRHLLPGRASQSNSLPVDAPLYQQPLSHSTPSLRPSLHITTPLRGALLNVSSPLEPTPSTPGLTQGATQEGRTESIRSVQEPLSPQPESTNKSATAQQPSAMKNETTIGQQFKESGVVGDPVLPDADDLSV
ncbi:hypothetical protein A1O1_01794 [Capronia coronata CBS 617.96]|uniref:PNPLA domain-containing protein n=1 Tax=Capronia coronata CBS 617.96 TaxID=1182541 RepID=W9YKJ9_9EURO|nr:uncharacterized protein A1O1_01794 [Capronia coronata CBS 617.96]EXJ93402.1 hypothetical protein A1O1_01794 [Capronia coronata CBS 617.96]